MAKYPLSSSHSPLTRSAAFGWHIIEMIVAHHAAGPAAALAFTVSRWLLQNWLISAVIAVWLFAVWVWVSRRIRVSAVRIAMEPRPIAMDGCIFSAASLRQIVRAVRTCDRGRLIALLHRDWVQRHGHAADWRGEILVPDPQSNTLRVDVSAGWAYSIEHRRYPIPGVSPCGGNSVAGHAFATGRLVSTDNWQTSEFYYNFADATDKACGRSQSVACIAIFAEEGGVPVAVLAIASRYQNGFDRAHFNLLHAYAIAVGETFGAREAA